MATVAVQELVTPFSITLGPDKLGSQSNPFASALEVPVSSGSDSPSYGFDLAEQQYGRTEYPYSVHDNHWRIEDGPNGLGVLVFAPKVRFAASGNLDKSVIVAVHPTYSEKGYSVQVFNPLTGEWLPCPNTQYDKETHLVKLPSAVSQSTITIPETEQGPQSVETKFRILKDRIPHLTLKTKTVFGYQESPRSPINATITIEATK